MPRLKPLSLSELISETMHWKELSNRSLAAAAGVSEGAIRNLLKFGEEGSKEPDPRTLRRVAEALNIRPATLFKLAGYLPNSRADNSWRALYVADVFDQLPRTQQDMVMGVLAALMDSPEVKAKLQERRIRDQNAQTLKAIPTIVREAANQLIIRYGMNSPEDIELIEPETQVVGQQWRRLDHQTQNAILALIEHKLALDFDPQMIIKDWD